eukprot:evm.model.scf_1626.5 EVM.evm.TU.scf_1626.5   scf_1626:30998-36652(+)
MDDVDELELEDDGPGASVAPIQPLPTALGPDLGGSQCSRDSDRIRETKSKALNDRIGIGGSRGHRRDRRGAGDEEGAGATVAGALARGYGSTKFDRSENSDLGDLRHPFASDARGGRQAPQRRWEAGGGGSRLGGPGMGVCDEGRSMAQPLPDGAGAGGAGPSADGNGVQAALLRIPGPAGRLQQSHRLLESAAAQAEHRHAGPPAELSDPDFFSEAWLAALKMLGVDEFPKCAGPYLQTIKSVLSEDVKGKLAKAVAFVSDLTINGSGAAFMRLKDPTGIIGAAVHKAVLTSHPNLQAGMALLLEQVSVFSAEEGLIYLCITPANILQVISNEPQRTGISPMPSFVGSGVRAGTPGEWSQAAFSRQGALDRRHVVAVAPRTIDGDFVTKGKIDRHIEAGQNLLQSPAVASNCVNDNWHMGQECDSRWPDSTVSPTNRDLLLSSEEERPSTTTAANAQTSAMLQPCGNCATDHNAVAQEPQESQRKQTTQQFAESLMNGSQLPDFLRTQSEPADHGKGSLPQENAQAVHGDGLEPCDLELDSEDDLLDVRCTSIAAPLGKMANQTETLPGYNSNAGLRGGIACEEGSRTGPLKRRNQTLTHPKDRHTEQKYFLGTNGVSGGLGCAGPYRKENVSQGTPGDIGQLFQEASGPGWCRPALADILEDGGGRGPSQVSQGPRPARKRRLVVPNKAAIRRVE